MGVDQPAMLREFGLAFGNRVGERAAGVVLEMPFGGDDMAHEPFELGRVVDQLGEQVPEVPVEQHLADVEDHALPNHKAPAHAKAPPEASDGVTLACTARTGRTRPGWAISPGAP